ncbi:MAG: DNRLRE domain-containing protein [Bacteroidota bacterium]
MGKNAHNFVLNTDPGPITLHTFGPYIASSFDVVHDNGLSTALYAGKSKFIVFENSYNASNGAEDITGEDNGRDKIDTYVYEGDMEKLTTLFVADYAEKQYDYAFFHFRNPDGQGHSTGWELSPNEDYAQKVAEVDVLLGQLFAVVENTPGLAGKTAIILTADHGGELGGKNHGNLFSPDNYTIPFYVWGPGVAVGADLYALNAALRIDPSTDQIYDEDAVQPIRYADVANLALAFLGLPVVPGSGFNVEQTLTVVPAAATNLVIQQGLNDYNGTIDTYIRRDEKDKVYGSNSTLIVDDADPWWSGRDNQALLRFENIIGNAAQQVPPNATITKATLNVRVVNAGDGGKLHRMLRPWTENDTWNTLSGGLSANDVEAVAQADSEVSDVAEGMLSIDVTASVQAWANGAENYGWVILPEGDNGWDFYSKEGFMPPRLTISYEFDAYQTRAAQQEQTATQTISNELLPAVASLEGNHPNPFSGATTIYYSIPSKQQVKLEVFNSQGQPVKVLFEGVKEAGRYEITFNAQQLPKGLYVLRFVAQGEDAEIILNHRMIAN